MSVEPLEAPVLIECEGSQLVGILHSATGDRRGVGVLIVVGGPQYRAGSHRQFVHLARGLAAAGYPVLRFDYRGMGDSDGAARTFEDVGRDIRAGVDALLARAPLEGVVLWGLCDAAAAILMYCRDDARLAGVAIANPWVRTPSGEARTYLRHYYVTRLLQASFWRKLLSGRLNVRKSVGDLAGAVQQAGGSGTDDAASARPSFLKRMFDGLSGFSKPILILLSERDLTAKEFSDKCQSDRDWRRAIARSTVSVASLSGCDHTFSTRATTDLVTRETLAWLSALARGAHR